MGSLPRGKHLIAADWAFATGGGLLASLFGGSFSSIIDRIDKNLVHGTIDLTLPDGTRRVLGGNNPGPAAIVHVHSWRAIMRLATSGSVGWYKAWTLGEWSCPDLVPLFALFMLNGENLGELGRAKGIWRRINRAAHFFRRNSKGRAKTNIAFHYDLGNDFYGAWLDRSMTYSSALFTEPMDDAEPLESAQARKIRTLLDRLNLQPGQHLLEIGCGWGSLAQIAACEYGVKVTGITLSPEQKAYADARMQKAGLSDRVSIELIDYRDVAGSFDAVASVEMVEAVGQDYWPAYLHSIYRALKPGGRAAIQLISMRESLFKSYAENADFIQTYIFPGGLLISEDRFRKIAESQGFVWQDRKGFGLHYAKTLKRWRKRYDMAVKEARLPTGFDSAFHNLWRYYLAYCEGGFRGRGIDVAQVTLVKE